MRFYLSDFFLSLAPCWRWDGSTPVACSDHVQVECAEKDNMRGEALSRVSLKFTHEHVAFIKLLQRFNVISKLLCPRSGVSGQLPLTRQAWVLVHSRLPKHRCLHLLVGKDVAPPFSWPAPANYEFHCYLHSSLCRCSSLFRVCSFFFFCSLSHFLLVIAKSRRFYSVLGQNFIFLLNFHAGPHKRRNPQAAHPAPLP